MAVTPPAPFVAPNLQALQIVTERLILRVPRADDLAAFNAMNSRNDVAAYLPRGVRTLDQSRRALVADMAPRLAADDDVMTLAVERRRDQAFIGEGVVILRSIAHMGGEVGYVVHPDHRGNGYATEITKALLGFGFGRVELHRIIGRIDARNGASARVLEKAGMRREAHFVQNAFTRGEWTDEVVFAMRASQWADRP